MSSQSPRYEATTPDGEVIRRRSKKPLTHVLITTTEHGKQLINWTSDPARTEAQERNWWTVATGPKGVSPGGAMPTFVTVEAHPE